MGGSKMKKTSEYIQITLLDGKVQKRYIYIDDNGTKYIYNQHGFLKLDDFIKNRK